MEKIKIKILKDHKASPNGIRILEYKKGEILELGEQRLTASLYDWHTRNSGFSEIVQEAKAIASAPENKMLEPVIENKALPIVEPEPIPEVIEAIQDPKQNKFINPFKRKK